MGRPKTIRASREVFGIDQLAHPPSIPEMLGRGATMTVRTTHIAYQMGSQMLGDIVHDARAQYERISGSTAQVVQAARALLHLN